MAGLREQDEEAAETETSRKGMEGSRGEQALSFSGFVVRGEGVEPKAYRDANGLESFLMELARGRGYGGVIDR